jgi:hypothetical protein
MSLLLFFLVTLQFLFYAISFHVAVERHLWRRLSLMSNVDETSREKPVGLLNGISNIKTAKYYSSRIDLLEAAKFALNDSYLMSIVRSKPNNTDIDQYLLSKHVTSDRFVKSNEVWDRTQLYQALANITSNKGCFACVLGGKSTGKSLVLESLFGQGEGKVIYVDMRTGYSSITEGLLSTLSDKEIDEIFKTLGATALEVISAFISKPGQTIGLKACIDYLQRESKPDSTYLSKILDKISESCNVTLVIDEANMAFAVDDKSSELKVGEVSKVLALFTKLTKQKQKVSLYPNVYSVFHGSRLICMLTYSSINSLT